MANRRSELLVVGGFVLALVLLGLREFKTKAPRQLKNVAEEAVRNGQVLEAERVALGCEILDGENAGVLDENDRLACYSRLVELEYGSGKVTGARAHLETALADAARLGPAIDPNTFSALLSVSSRVYRLQDRARSEADARSALSRATDLRHQALANLRLGEALERAPAAEAPLRKALAQYAELEGPEGPNVAGAKVGLGTYLEGEEAVAVLEGAAKIYENIIDGGHPFGAKARFALANARVDLGDFAGAEKDIRSSLATTRASYGPASPNLVDELCYLGVILHAQGRAEEALSAVHEGIALSGGQTACRRELAYVTSDEGRPHH